MQRIHCPCGQNVTTVNSYIYTSPRNCRTASGPSGPLRFQRCFLDADQFPRLRRLLCTLLASPKACQAHLHSLHALTCILRRIGYEEVWEGGAGAIVEMNLVGQHLAHLRAKTRVGAAASGRSLSAGIDQVKKCLRILASANVLGQGLFRHVATEHGKLCSCIPQL